MKIFVSYRSLDREIVRGLVHDLEDIGLDVWSDMQLSGGQDWWENILAGIRDCDLFIFILTKNWFESEACVREYDYAVALAKDCLPIQVENVELDAMPKRVRRLQIVKYKADEQTSFRAVMRAIHRFGGQKPLPQPLPPSPPSPLEALAQYDQQLRQLTLERDAQTAMVKYLKNALQKRENAQRARQLLTELRQHPSTSDSIANRIDVALASRSAAFLDDSREPEAFARNILPLLPKPTDLPQRETLNGDIVSELAVFPHPMGTVYGVTFSPDGTLLATASEDRTIRLWNMVDFQPLSILAGHDSSVRDVAFSPDGLVLASASMDCTVRLWSLDNSGTVKVLKGHNDWVLRLSYSPYGDLLASTSVNEVTKLWNTETQEEIATLSGHSGWVSAAAFSPDGTVLATSSHDSTIRFWNVSRRRKMHMVNHDGVLVQDICYAPNGTMLAAALKDCTVRLWAAAHFTEIDTLNGHDAPVNRVVFSPDNTLLAAGMADGMLKLWNMYTRKEAILLQAHDSAISSVAFNPEGTLLATAAEDGKVKLWGVA